MESNIFILLLVKIITAAIFSDIEKANREKTLEQLENMRIQGRMMEFIRELIIERWINMRVGGFISQR